MGLIIPEVFIILLTDAVFTLLLLYLAPVSFAIAARWDGRDTSESQYRLEKKRYLISSAVRLIFLFKIPLFLFYIYANDRLADVLTGAMCAAGSVNATPYGSWLLWVKILELFMMSGWLVIQKCNSSSEQLPHTKTVYKGVLIITAAAAAGTVLDFLNFGSMDPSAVVSCCSSIYSAGAEGASYIMSIKPFTAFFTFSVFTALLFLSLILKRPKLAAVLSIAFFLTGVLNLILFTGTYVYELPTHKCPFCILQKEYGYIGYAFYISLFMAASSGINSFISHSATGRISLHYIRLCFFFTLVFYSLSVFYPLRYYLLNNVWL